MADKVYTGIFSRTLLTGDFDTTQFDGQAITAGVPVRLYYQVLPGNELAFGAGSSSLGGVRTSNLLQLLVRDSQGTPVTVSCRYRLIYTDSNRIRNNVVRESITDNVQTAPTAYTSDAAAQAAYLPETVGMRVGAFSYLCIELQPVSTSAGNAFSAANTVVQLPVTNYTLSNASGA